jgi:23S rRNA pseudouridine2605 synthase
MTDRLQKVLAHAGVASRRAAEQLIREQRVRVNGAVVTELGTQVDAARDRIEVDGQPLPTQTAARQYVLLFKPLGMVSTAFDPEGRPTVVEAVRSRHRLYPVGRLDIDSDGLVLLTDDGELTYRLTHARFGVEKEYHVLARCPMLGQAELAQLLDGVELEDGLARAVRADLLRRRPDGVGLRVVLVEGRHRQVRRMLAAIGCAVDELRRVRFGPLRLGELEPGEYRSLRPLEIAQLRRAVGLAT